MHDQRMGGDLDGLIGENGPGDPAWQHARMEQLRAEADLRRN